MKGKEKPHTLMKKRRGHEPVSFPNERSSGTAESVRVTSTRRGPPGWDSNCMAKSVT